MQKKHKGEKYLLFGHRSTYSATVQPMDHYYKASIDLVLGAILVENNSEKASHLCGAHLRRRIRFCYLRWFTLSYRDVEDLLAERGLEVSNESIRRWVLNYGSEIARNIRIARPRARVHWHLDEMVVWIGGQQMNIGRAVDSEDEVLDILIQRRREEAALKLMRSLVKKQGFAPAVIVTDKLGSHGTALRTIGFSGQHEQALRANSRAENSHQPVRRGKRKMGGLQIAQVRSALCFVIRRRLQHLHCSTTADLLTNGSVARGEAHSVWSDATAAGA